MSVDYSRRGLRRWPVDLENHKDAISLILSGNELTEVPAVIAEFTELRVLDLSKNRLRRLPNEVTLLKNLWRLIIDDNDIEQLPDEIGQLVNLRDVYVRKNRLTSLPESLCDLSKLRELFLGDNQLSVLPECIGRMENLRELELDHNCLTELPSTMGHLSYLKRLSLRDNQLAELPGTFGQLTRLECFSCANNQLTDLPADFANLKQLRELDLACNRLALLPEDIGRLSSLTLLDVRGNRITKLPVSVTQLRLASFARIRMYDSQPAALPVSNLTKRWDVFISHATEDKEDVALPLAKVLQAAGLRVWLDTIELRVGDSLRAKIDEGLSQSRFGAIVLSPRFLEKKWTVNELNALMSIEQEGQYTILPIWHGISHSKLARAAPLFADRIAVDTSSGIRNVALKILDAVLYGAGATPERCQPSVTGRLVDLVNLGCRDMEVIQFLREHESVLCAANGGFVPEFSTEIDPELPGVFCRALLSPGWAYFYVVPATLAAELFCADGSLNGHVIDKIEALKARLAERSRTGPSLQGRWPIVWSGSKRSGPISTVIAGRREALTTGERARLSDLNDQLTASGIRLRTFDWLIDACVLVADSVPRSGPLTMRSDPNGPLS